MSYGASFLEFDTGSSCVPFLGNLSILIDVLYNLPEVFFNCSFNDFVIDNCWTNTMLGTKYKEI